MSAELIFICCKSVVVIMPAKYCDLTIAEIKKLPEYKNIPKGYNKSKLNKKELCKLIAKKSIHSRFKKTIEKKKIAAKKKTEEKKKIASKKKTTEKKKVTGKKKTEEKKKTMENTPAVWDFDKHVTRLPSLIPYRYVYVAGSSPSEVERYYDLPDDFTLLQYLEASGEKGPRSVLITYKQWKQSKKKNVLTYIPGTLIEDEEGNLRIHRNIASPLPARGTKEYNMILDSGVYNMNSRTLTPPQWRLNGMIVGIFKN